MDVRIVLCLWMLLHTAVWTRVSQIVVKPMSYFLAEKECKQRNGFLPYYLGMPQNINLMSNTAYWVYNSEANTTSGLCTLLTTYNRLMIGLENCTVPHPYICTFVSRVDSTSIVATPTTSKPTATAKTTQATSLPTTTAVATTTSTREKSSATESVGTDITTAVSTYEKSRSFNMTMMTTTMYEMSQQRNATSASTHVSLSSTVLPSESSQKIPVAYIGAGVAVGASVVAGIFILICIKRRSKLCFKPKNNPKDSTNHKVNYAIASGVGLKSTFNYYSTIKENQNEQYSITNMDGYDQVGLSDMNTGTTSKISNQGLGPLPNRGSLTSSDGYASVLSDRTGSKIVLDDEGDYATAWEDEATVKNVCDIAHPSSNSTRTEGRQLSRMVEPQDTHRPLSSKIALDEDNYNTLGTVVSQQVSSSHYSHLQLDGDYDIAGKDKTLMHEDAEYSHIRPTHECDYDHVGQVTTNKSSSAEYSHVVFDCEKEALDSSDFSPKDDQMYTSINRTGEISRYAPDKHASPTDAVSGHVAIHKL